MSNQPINPDFIERSLERCARWHTGGLTDWSLNDWLCATGGELGEAMNAAKKLRRIEDGIANLSDLKDVQVAQDAILEELADVACYLVLAAARVTLDPDALNRSIVTKFNAVSARYGFPETL